MGIDPAPFMANLHFYENTFVTNLVNSGDLDIAKRLRFTFRYIDDLLNINDKEYFENNLSEIYPNVLKLTKTNNNKLNTEFLDLNINIVDNRIISTVFDKRRAFAFKVINYPNVKHSNIPTQPAYGIYLSQIMRIIRICNKYDHFQNELNILTNEFLCKGYKRDKLIIMFNKFIVRYPKEWGKFGVEIELPEPLK